MKRLTRTYEENNQKYVCIGVCGEKCIEGNEWCPDCEPFVNVMKKLAEYEDAEEQGLLLRLPCKVGQTIYYILGIPTKTPCIIEETVFDLSDIDKIGKTFFLTKEEAEQALAKMKEV